MLRCNIEKRLRPQSKLKSDSANIQPEDHNTSSLLVPIESLHFPRVRSKRYGVTRFSACALLHSAGLARKSALDLERGGLVIYRSYLVLEQVPNVACGHGD